MPDINTQHLPARLFGLIGYPLAQSYSKQYFDKKFLEQQLTNCSFRNFPIKDIDSFLPDVVHSNPELEGIAVTIPYKKQVLKYLEDRSNIPVELAACNCIRIRNGKLAGFNTDAIGFKQSLEPLLAPGMENALILGTGGAAEAVKYALNEMGIGHLSVSRQSGNKTIGYADINERLIASHRLIINTTPLGMFPNVDETPALPYHFLTNNHLLYDLVYNPAITGFMKRGIESGATAVNGEKMLAIQAEENWKIWNS